MTMDVTLLTDRQRREMTHFDRKEELDQVDLAHFDSRRFGPWNAYYTVYDRVRSLRRNRPQRLLSFGCGRGANALRYAQLGYHVSGFDISPACVENAGRLGRKYGLARQLDFSTQAAESLRYPDHSFDVVAGEDILHHVDIPRALAEIHRVLRPGGTAIFKDSIRTPVRDVIRRSPPLSWLLPPGMKSLATGSRYHATPDERPLGPEDLAAIRRVFPQLNIEKFRVAALASVLVGHKAFFERLDWLCFRCIPGWRQLGDVVVLTMEKGKGERRISSR